MTTTTTTKKITKAQKNMDIISVLKNETPKFGTTIEEMIAHLELTNAQLAKKSASSSNGERKLTKAQEANEEYKQTILEYLSKNPNLIVTSTSLLDSLLRKTYPSIIWTNQKVTALLTALSDKYDKETGELVSEGKLIRTKEKKGITFQIKPEYVSQ